LKIYIVNKQKAQSKNQNQQLKSFPGDVRKFGKCCRKNDKIGINKLAY